MSYSIGRAIRTERGIEIPLMIHQNSHMTLTACRKLITWLAGFDLCFLRDGVPGEGFTVLNLTFPDEEAALEFKLRYDTPELRSGPFPPPPGDE